jgi:hypothetical protein
MKRAAAFALEQAAMRWQMAAASLKGFREVGVGVDIREQVRHLLVRDDDGTRTDGAVYPNE